MFCIAGPVAAALTNKQKKKRARCSMAQPLTKKKAPVGPWEETFHNSTSFNLRKVAAELPGHKNAL